jgi:hypothetical protein
MVKKPMQWPLVDPRAALTRSKAWLSRSGSRQPADVEPPGVDTPGVESTVVDLFGAESAGAASADAEPVAGATEGPAPLNARRRMLSTLSLVGVLVVIVALAQTSPGQSLMRLTGLAKAPAAYTALSFTDTDGLPTTVPEGHVGLDVSFTIHNATQSADTYRWAVRLVHGSKSQAGTHGTVTVDAGGTKGENTPVSTVCDSGTLEVIVTLTAPSESIHFRAACGG